MGPEARLSEVASGPRSTAGDAGAGVALPLLDASIVLVRHGESMWIVEGRFQGQGDSPLSDLGHRQAALVGARLHDPFAVPQLPVPSGPPIGVWHSPLARTRQTAETVAAARPAGADVVLRPMPEMMEIAQGAWEGLPHAEVASRYGAELAAWRRSPTTSWAPGGESLAVAGDRVRRGLATLLTELGRGQVPADPAALPTSRVLSTGDRPAKAPWAIVVAHDGVMRVILMTLLDIPFERFWSFPFALCGIGVLDIRGGVASLRAHNLVDHLAPLEHEARAAAEARGDRAGAL